MKYALLFISLCFFQCLTDKTESVTESGDRDPLIYYFPAYPGKIWEYDAFYGFQATSSMEEYSGKESWEILSFSEKYKNGQIRCSFKGTKTDLEWGKNEFDTVLVEPVNCSKIYDIQLSSGVFYAFNIRDGECKTVFDFFIKYFLIDDRFVIGFFPDYQDEINIKIDGDPELYQEYTLKKDIGLLNFTGRRCSIFGGPYLKYDIIQ
ncbi:hypothetical protein JW835_05905 [bacterium]|nr:hypothetical protein [bacterium]